MYQIEKLTSEVILLDSKVMVRGGELWVSYRGRESIGAIDTKSLVEAVCRFKFGRVPQQGVDWELKGVHIKSVSRFAYNSLEND